jgi:hypothetical protein
MKMINDLQQEHKNMVNLAAILFFATCFLYLAYLRNLERTIFENKDYTSAINMFRLVDKNFRYNKSRPLLIKTELLTQINTKINNSKSSGSLTPISAYNTTFISNSLFKNLEFAVAELCIIYGNLITKITDEHIQMLAKEKIVDVIEAYQGVWQNRSLATFSMFNRMMQNMCHICEDNTHSGTVDCYRIMHIVKDILHKRFKFKDDHFIYYMRPDYDIFNSKIKFWTPDTEIKLKNLRKLIYTMN